MKMKVVFMFFLIILSIGFFACFDIAVKKPHSLSIIGGDDGPTVVYINGLNDGEELFFNESDIEIITNDKNRYELRIINNEKIDLLKKNIYTTMSFTINGLTITAKGHPAHSSRMSYGNSDFYFLADPEGKPMFIYGNENIITLNKTNKTHIAPEIEFDIDKIETKERN